MPTIISTPSEAIAIIEKARSENATFVDLGRCGLTALPDELFTLIGLQGLNLGEYFGESFEKNYSYSNAANKGERNQFSSSELGRLGKFKDSLLVLSLIRTGTQDINGLADLTQLRSLFLSSTDIQYTDTLSEMTQLHTLDLGHTNTKDISALAKLTQLRALYLRDTRIQDFSVLAKLTLLQVLDLSHTRIQNIDILTGLTQLQDLNLNSTHVKFIDKLAKLTQLQTLDLNFTKVQDVSVLLKLNKLQDLNLVGIDIQNGTQVAKILAKNRFLTRLWVGKEIPGIPEGLEYNADGLRDFFKKQKRLSRTEHNRSLKLIILGNTRAGKTQMLNRLIGRPYQNKSISTDGLNIKVWLPKIGKFEYRITCFDFGGQDFYHATHNLYLDNRALYLVLWHPHTIEQSQHLPLGYWLGNIDYFTEGIDHNMAIWTIQSRADESPRQWANSDHMVLYGTEADGQFYLSIQEAKVAGSRWKSEWNYFRQALYSKIQALAKNVTPSNYEIIAVRDVILPQLKKQKRMVISQHDFILQCRKNTRLKQFDPNNSSDYSSTLSVLRAAGELLWYPNVSTGDDYIVIDPSRWAKFIFSILGRNNMAKNDGEFDQQSLETVIKTSNVHQAEKRWLPKLFVTLLQKYQLIFEKPDTSGRYVVPQYLPEQPLEQYLKNLLPITLVVRYEHYMPFWRITHFITQKATATHEPHYWRYGIIYKEEGCTVMVRIQRPLVVAEKTTESEAKLYVHVDGPAEARIQLLTEILDFFGRIHQFGSSGSPKLLLPETAKSDILDFDLTARHDSRGKPAFIKRIRFSINDWEFFAVDALQEALSTEQKLLKCSSGEVLAIPALFYPILNIKNTMPKRVFFSYAHADAQYRRELDVHFAALKRGQHVETWHDMEIAPGENWDQRIKDEIEKADLVLALISPDFMNSSYVWDQELPRMKDKFVPIFLRPCDFDETHIAPVQGLPKHYEDGDKDISKGIRWIVSSQWQYRDEAYLAVINALKQLLKK